MKKVITDLVNLRFYKYFRVGAVLIGIVIVLYVELFGFPEPMDIGVDWEQLQRESEKVGEHVYGDNDTGKISIKHEGDLEVVKVWNPETREWERLL